MSPRLPYLDPDGATEETCKLLSALPALHVFKLVAQAETAFEPLAALGKARAAASAPPRGQHRPLCGRGIGVLFLPVLMMPLFREKYPRWWYDWNLQLTRFGNRIAVYFALMDDEYASTDEEQAVRLDFPYLDAERDLNRGLVIIKWRLAIPHYVVLFFLTIGALLAAIVAWFASDYQAAA